MVVDWIVMVDITTGKQENIILIEENLISVASH